MNKKNFLTLLITFLLVSFLSCAGEGDKDQSGEVQSFELPDEGIEIVNARARPANVNGVSAIYMNVLNGSSHADTLVSLTSPAAEMVEVHETYEREEGMMGMRPAEMVIVPAEDAMILKPGGFHVMLMQLNRELAEGDEVELTVEFSNAGKMTISAPVHSL